MAVGQARMTRSKRGMRRSHDALKNPTRGRQIIKNAVEVEDDAE